MASRSTTIWSCDRCGKETEKHGGCPYTTHVWFRVGSFEIGEVRNGTLQNSKLLCDDCAKVLHLWWNEGASVSKETS